MASLRHICSVLLVSTTLYLEVHSGTVSFCDGSELIEKTRDQCGAGISFGDNKPDCICVSGIYRFLADTCETADGFADKVCTKITDDSGMGASIVGVKFTRDPVNWTHTGVVCERKGFGTETWDYITEKHSRGATTKSGNIYALNGKAFITTGHYDKPAFCVEPAKVPDDETVCRYLQSENEGIWKHNEVEVIVSNKCDGSPVVPHKCFGVLTSRDSECQLQCSASTAYMGRSMGRSVGGVASPGKSTNKLPPPAKGGTKPAVLPVPEKPEDTIHPAEYWKHDNKYLNRKMMIFNIISQLDAGGNGTNSSAPTVNVTDHTTWGEPKRTFEIFDTMKKIATSYCPAIYVTPEWVNLVIEMFYILHKGNVFRYDENLSPFEHAWIKDILGKCKTRIEDNSTRADNVVVLESDPTGGTKKLNFNEKEEICNADGGGKAMGYCNGTNPEGDCNFIPIPVEPHRANDAFHYVPDVAWDIVDLLQVVCFKEFNESYRMFHVIEQAAEKLFTLQIKNLWYYPTWSEKTKKRLLGSSADTQMHNLEVCINSAYHINGQIPRLVRPGPTKYLRKKRSVSKEKPSSVGQYVDVYCGRTRKDLITPECSRA